MENNINTENVNHMKNYMDGVSFKLSPVETLYLVTASYIRGEPQFYKKGTPIKKKHILQKYLKV